MMEGRTQRHLDIGLVRRKGCVWGGDTSQWLQRHRKHKLQALSDFLSCSQREILSLGKQGLFQGFVLLNVCCFLFAVPKIKP